MQEGDNYESSPHDHINLEDGQGNSKKIKCLEASKESLSIPLGFGQKQVSLENDNRWGENENGVSTTQKKHSESLEDVGEDDILEEVRKEWELGKKLGFPLDNEIDAIWALTKNRRIKKGKKNNLRGRKKGGKEGVSK